MQCSRALAEESLARLLQRADCEYVLALEATRSVAVSPAMPPSEATDSSPAQLIAAQEAAMVGLYDTLSTTFPQNRTQTQVMLFEAIVKQRAKAVETFRVALSAKTLTLHCMSTERRSTWSSGECHLMPPVTKVLSTTQIGAVHRAATTRAGRSHWLRVFGPIALHVTKAVLAPQMVAAQETCGIWWTREQLDDHAWRQRYLGEDAAAARRSEVYLALAVTQNRSPHLLLDGDLIAQSRRA